MSSPIAAAGCHCCCPADPADPAASARSAVAAATTRSASSDRFSLLLDALFSTSSSSPFGSMGEDTKSPTDSFLSLFDPMKSFQLQRMLKDLKTSQDLEKQARNLIGQKDLSSIGIGPATPTEEQPA